MSSRTWSIRTAKLMADKEAASVVVRLMMALNDIAMANEGLGEWTVTQERRKLARQNGGRLYYGRMLMAHVYEALSIIEDIQVSPKLKMLLDACDPATQSSFDRVAAFLKAADYGMLCRIRNNASFHYDSKLAVRAVEQIDKKFPAHTAVDGQTLTLKYKDGEKKIFVPANTPIVVYVPGDKSDLKPGAKVFIVAIKQPDGTLQGRAWRVGRDGVTPPM